MTSAERLTNWFGPSGARIALLAAAALLAIIIVGDGALIVVEALRVGLLRRAAVWGLLDLLALGLWLRMVRTRWLQLRVLSELPAGTANEPTGIWGVGGPGVRVPGGTGQFNVRRTDADDDTEGGAAS